MLAHGPARTDRVVCALMNSELFRIGVGSFVHVTPVTSVSANYPAPEKYAAQMKFIQQKIK